MMSMEMLETIAVAIPSWTTVLVVIAVAADGALLWKRLASSLAALLAKAKYLKEPTQGVRSGPRIQSD